MIETNRLILLPGMDGTGKLFAPLLRELPKNYQATTISYPPDQKLTYEQLKPLIFQAMPADEPFVLIAESFSGPLAVEITATQPTNLQSLILCASFIRNPALPVFEWVAKFNHPRWFRFCPPAMLVRYALAMWDAEEKIVRNLLEAINEVKPEVLSHRLAQVLQADAREQLKNCEVPIFYLRAQRDSLVGKKSWQEIYQLKPNAIYQEIDASHFVLQHKPVESWAAIKNFLSNISAL